MKKALTFLTAIAFGSASENAFLADDEFLAKRPKDLTHIFNDDELLIKRPKDFTHVFTDDELLIKRPKDFTHVFADDELGIKQKIMRKVAISSAADDELLVRDPRDSMHIFTDDELSVAKVAKYPHYQRRPVPKAADNSLYRFGGNLVQNWHYPLKPMNTYVPPQSKPEESAPVESSDENVSARFGGNLVRNWHYPLKPINTFAPPENKAEERSVLVDEEVSSRVGGNLVKNWHYPLPPINTFVPVENKPKVEEETLESALFTLKQILKESGKKYPGKNLHSVNKGIFDGVRHERQDK